MFYMSITRTDVFQGGITTWSVLYIALHYGILWRGVAVVGSIVKICVLPHKSVPYLIEYVP